MPNYKLTGSTSSVLIQAQMDPKGHYSKEYPFEEKHIFPATPVFLDGISWVPIKNRLFQSASSSSRIISSDRQMLFEALRCKRQKSFVHCDEILICLLNKACGNTF